MHTVTGNPTHLDAIQVKYINLQAPAQLLNTIINQSRLVVDCLPLRQIMSPRKSNHDHPGLGGEQSEAAIP